MRFRLRLFTALSLGTGWLAAWGCYSSNAAPRDAEEVDAGFDAQANPPGIDSGPCDTRKPWEGPGITGILPSSGTEALILNGDRYAVAEFNLTGTDAADPEFGRVVAWHGGGLLKDLWSSAPAALGNKPWEGPGVTAAYIDRESRAIIISQFRRWIYNGTTWDAKSIVQDLVINDAGPPVPDGGRAPWEGPGITGTSFKQDGVILEIVSQDREWHLDTADGKPENYRWLGNTAYPLASTQGWANAPAVGNQRPWEGKGVTAIFNLRNKFFVFSGDRMWTSDRTNWFASGMVKDQPGWGGAPSISCR